MPARMLEWTAEMARAIPNDGNRYEVLDGELFVSPSPVRLHQRAIGALYRRLFEYVVTHRVGELLHSPADIEFSPRRLVQPDLFVTRELGVTFGQTWRDVRGLVLAIEVLSPSTARADRQVKSRIYMEEDVGEYWIVDLDARVVERWSPGERRPEIVHAQLIWQPLPTVPELSIDLTAFFLEVLGES